MEIEPNRIVDAELKKRILTIIKRSHRGEAHLLDKGDKIILFHWAQHMNEPMYDFVPKKYRK